MSNDTFGSRASARLAEVHPGKPLRLVAQETGLHYITLNNALNDETKPRYATAKALAAYLDCPVGYLLDGEGLPEKKSVALTEADEGYRAGYRDGYADAMKMITAVEVPA